MKNNFLLLTVFLFVVFIFKLHAQAGELDTSFNASSSGADGNIETVSLQSDGKIIIGGSFSTYNYYTRNGITRLNTDGTLDLTFNAGSGANNDVVTSSIQSDGKIIIGGYFTTFDGAARKRIARLNTDGTLDGTFNPGTGADGFIGTTSIQSDGKIIIGGGFNYYNGIKVNYIARLNTDGSLDTTFNSGIGAEYRVFTTSIQSDGKIIIGGWFTSYDGVGRNYVARLNTDGTLDTSFNPGTGFNYIVYASAIQSDGKILLAGDFTSFNGIERNRIIRLNTDGTLDISFQIGTGLDNVVLAIITQNDGKILIGGNINDYNGTAIHNRIVRINSDGSLDNTFYLGSGLNYGEVNSIAIQSDEKIIIGCTFDYRYDGSILIKSIARLQNDTSLSIEQKNANNTLKIYPNPVNNLLNLKGKEELEIVNITITDILGKKVLEMSQDFEFINVEALPKGLYFLKINVDSQNVIRKFIKN